MQNMLDEIITNKKLDIQRRKTNLSLDEIKQTITLGNGSFLRAIQKTGLNIIAEIKPKSPSAGNLCSDLRVSEIVRIYNKYACAISVLTDGKFFGGSFELLSEIRHKSHLPILCKDFVLDPFQCFLARQSGAQAILLIVKILGQKVLNALYQQVNDLGMTAVIEVQNMDELESAMLLQPEPEVILINNRNLEDFKISFDTTKIIGQSIKNRAIKATVISASGLQSKTDIEELVPYCSTFLVGSQFMRSDNLEEEFKKLLDIKLPLPLASVEEAKK